jgi:hypothetical protein
LTSNVQEQLAAKAELATPRLLSAKTLWGDFDYVGVGANRKVDICIPGFTLHGYMDVTLTSSDFPGVLVKRFVMDCAAGASPYSVKSYYVVADGTIAQNFAIGEPRYNGATGSLEIPVAFLTSAVNASYGVVLEAFSSGELHQLQNATMSLPYVTDATVFPTPVTSAPLNSAFQFKDIGGTAATGQWVKIARIQRVNPIDGGEAAQFTGVAYFGPNIAHTSDQAYTAHFSFGSRGTSMKPSFLWLGDTVTNVKFQVWRTADGWTYLYVWQGTYSKFGRFMYAETGCTEYWTVEDPATVSGATLLWDSSVNDSQGITQLGTITCKGIKLAAGTQETGTCGVLATATAGAQTWGNVCNFKATMTNTPSSVTLVNVSVSNAGSATIPILTKEGFRFYVNSTAAGLVAAHYTYTTVGN